MNWSDTGLVVGVRAHGESATIAELLTRDHGRHLGVVHGGRSRRMRPLLQPGNRVAATWRARLEEQMGTFAVEAEALRAARLMSSPLALSGLATLAGHLRLLAEREPHPDLFDAADALAEHLDDDGRSPALLALFELRLLAELGFGLDLSSCAATGAAEDLAWVSPKSGRAVGRVAGEPWRDRLLRLPDFLSTGEVSPPVVPKDLSDAFRLTGLFLDRHVYGPRGIHPPDERARFVARAAASSPSGADTIAEEASPEADSLRTASR